MSGREKCLEGVRLLAPFLGGAWEHFVTVLVARRLSSELIVLWRSLQLDGQLCPVHGQ